MRFKDWNINQPLLLPRSVDEFVGEDHLASFIKVLVLEDLDLSEILSKYDKDRGCTPYDPRMMLSILLYSYTQGIYSSRKIAKCCEVRVDYMSLSAMSFPDFRTISYFRKNHLTAIGRLFVQVLKLCQEVKLAKLGHVSLDGTKMKANASKGKSMKYGSIKKKEAELNEEVAKWLEKCEATDAEEDKIYGEDKRGDELPSWVSDKQERSRKLKEARESMEQKHTNKQAVRDKAIKEGIKQRIRRKRTEKPSDDKKYNFTDPDSSIMKSSQGFIQGYNAQIGVDSDSHVIVSCHVTTEGNDIDQLRPAIEQIEKNLNKLPNEISADYGYLSEENLKILEDKNINGYIAVGAKFSEYKRTPQKGSLVNKMIHKLKRGGTRTRYRLRKETVELPFGDIKENRTFRQFLLRGYEKVQDEWSLVCMTYNIRKLYNTKMAI
jgi:transposase